MAADCQGLSSSKNPDLLCGPPDLLFNRLRWQEREADHSPSRSGAMPSPPFMMWTSADGVVLTGEEVRRSDSAIMPSTARPVLGMVVQLTQLQAGCRFQ